MPFLINLLCPSFQIVITEGQTILLDTDTPILFFLLINGGTLMFDKEAPSIELNSKYILVAGGGKLIIGTEDEPYENKATVTMHGNVRCTEMPVFGCKVCKAVCSCFILVFIVRLLVSAREA